MMDVIWGSYASKYICNIKTNKMNKVSIKHLSNLHNDWMRGLEFYTQEIAIMKNRLTEVAGKNTDKSVMVEVEHFENQFIIKKDTIDTLSHNIRENVNKISHQAENSSAGFVDENLVAIHDELGAQVKTEEHAINELRHEFNRFAAKWM